MKNEITIATHGANFHADDVCAVATLVLHIKLQDIKNKHKTKIRIVRSLDREVYSKADFVVDIGGEYSVKKQRFDHHQEGGAGVRDNKVPYASFGLVWKTYGKYIAGSQYAAAWIDKNIVQAIDAMDNGMYLYTPTISDIPPFLFSDYIFAVCDNVKDSALDSNTTIGQKSLYKKFDTEFLKLVRHMEEVLKTFIIKAQHKEVVHKQAKAAYQKAKDKRCIVSNIYIPTRFDEFKSPTYVEPLVFVYPDLRGGWSAKVVPVGSQTYESRVSFPISWRGKKDSELEKVTGVVGAKFCHNSGFLLVASDKEAIIKLLGVACKDWKIPPFEF